MYAKQFFNTIDPLEETIAFESLWALEGMTESKLTGLFKSASNDSPLLPTQALEKLKREYLCNRDFSKINIQPIDSIRSDVLSYIKTKMGQFSICLNGDFQYPKDLRKAKHPLELFYYRGNLDLLNARLISIVGAREASQEGVLRATRLAKELGQAGLFIVSGLAKGIDTAALTLAIANGNKVVAVIGTPIDKVYPKENGHLQDIIASEHLLISQVPFFQYAQESFKEHRFHFPRRNATMAAISEGTVIVEASESSGTLIQARACIQQGKPLFILDSCFNNSNITWPYHYLKLGAIRVKKTEDILQNLPSSVKTSLFNENNKL